MMVVKRTTFWLTVWGAFAPSWLGMRGTVYGFTGEQHDSASSLLYLRARYYSPYIKVFMSIDPYAGNLGQPSSLHGYIYVGNNPVNRTDPSGLCEEVADEACWSAYEAIQRRYPEALSNPLLPAAFGFPGKEIKELPENTLIGMLRYLKQQAGFDTQPFSSPYDRFDRTLPYMFQEMVANAQSRQATSISAMLDLANCPDFLAPVPYPQAPPSGNYVIAALSTWTAMVRAGGPWDHKTKLDQMLGLGATPPDGDYFFPIRGDSEHEFYYDIWSNIHFGYVGRAAGLDAETLQSGAAAGDFLAGTNDDADILNVQIGIDLWQRHRLGLTSSHLHQAILAHTGDYLRIRDKTGGRVRVIIDKTNFR
jgi:RHS repeat-associated protein